LLYKAKRKLDKQGYGFPGYRYTSIMELLWCLNCKG